MLFFQISAAKNQQDNFLQVFNGLARGHSRAIFYLCSAAWKKALFFLFVFFSEFARFFHLLCSLYECLRVTVHLAQKTQF